MEPLVIETELETRDWEALQLYLHRQFLERGLSLRQRLVEFLMVALTVAVSMYALRYVSGAFSPLALLAGVLIGTIGMVLILRRRQKQFRPTPGSFTLARTRLEFDAGGVHSARPGLSSFLDWRQVTHVDETAEHVFLPIDRLLAYVIPKRSVVSISPDALIAQLRQWHAAAHESAPLEHGQAPSGHLPPARGTSAIWSVAQPLQESPGFLRGLKSNLRAGARIFFLRQVQPGAIVSTFDQVIALLAVTLVAKAGADWLRVGPGAEFEYYGIYSWSTFMILGVWVCALTARTLTPKADTRALLVPALAVAPYVIVCISLLSLVPPLAANEALFMSVAAMLTFAMSLRAVRVVHGFVRAGTLLVIAASVFGVAASNEYLYLDTRIWSEPEADEAVSQALADHNATESIFFAEPRRIAEAVGKLEPERPGVSDVFYVGFAGDGFQRVFRREVLLGQRVFAERMASGTRSLTLINDYEDRTSFPLGTASGLRYGLELLGARMNVNEDVLVLMLTSHGSQETGIAVRNGILPMKDVAPADLRSALDAAGIKWRIVIVSACYAGVFIEPLKSDTTLVMTAADAEHNSFGCADDRDLTYFGEAFLRDALPRAATLEGAFQAAHAAIGRRERAENKTPSNPQLFIGSAIRAKLANLGGFPLGAAPTRANN